MNIIVRIFTYPITRRGGCRGLWHLVKWSVVLAKYPPEVLLRGNPQFEQLLEKARPRPSRPGQYTISSYLLHKCYRHLTSSPCENLHLVAGMAVNGSFVLTELVALENVQQSLMGAVAGPLETRDGLLVMDAFGLQCGGLFHSHPGTGVGSCSPSSTDWANQRVWEQAYPLVGAVFSRDGYARFFSTAGTRAEVRGKKVRKIRENLFQIID